MAGSFLRGPLFARLNDAMEVSSTLQSYGYRGQGWFFVILGSISFLAFLYAAIVSRFLPVSESPNATVLESNRYYCILVPLTLPILVVAVYFHWVSMKLFKHA